MSYKPNEKYDYAKSQIEKLLHEISNPDKEVRLNAQVLPFYRHMCKKFENRMKLIDEAAHIDNVNE